MHGPKGSFTLTALIAMIVFTSAPCAGSPDVSVTQNPQHQETTYSLADGNNGLISIATRQGGTDRGLIHLRSTSALPLADQAALLSTVLNEVFLREDRAAVRTLFIGRLVYAFGTDTTMSERLVFAAARSPLWGRTKGKPVGLHENAAVEKMAEQAMIYRELRDLFRRYGLHLRVATVEKVLVGRPAEMPFGKTLSEGGIRPSDRLPYDVMTWFSVTSMDRDKQLGGGYWMTGTMVYWRWRTMPRTPPDTAVTYDFREVRGADPSTFRFLAERVEGVWGRDKLGIYFFEQRMEGADTGTWQPLDFGYSKDRRAVYRGASRLWGVNPGTFVVPDQE